MGKGLGGGGTKRSVKGMSLQIWAVILQILQVVFSSNPIQTCL